MGGGEIEGEKRHNSASTGLVVTHNHLSTHNHGNHLVAAAYNRATRNETVYELTVGRHRYGESAQSFAVTVPGRKHIFLLFRLSPHLAAGWPVVGRTVATWQKTRS